MKQFYLKAMKNLKIKRATLAVNSLLASLLLLITPMAATAQDSESAKNPLEISVGLQGSLLQANDAWLNTSGGDNSIALLSSLSLSHTYTKSKFSLESKLSARFGYNRMNTEIITDDEVTSRAVWFKNQDELNISVSPTWKFTEKWSYGATVTFRTQFADGYLSRQQQESEHLMSGFMAPGYLDVAGGVVWTNLSKTYPLTIRLSPVAMSAVYVCRESVRENFAYQFGSHDEENFIDVAPYGVTYPNSSKYEGGSSIQVNFEMPIDKNGVVRYKSSLYSFYGWFTQLGNDSETLAIVPTARWENTLDVKMTRILSATIDYRLYFDRAQDLGIQTQTLVNIGLVYTFDNKPKPKKQ